MAKVFTFLITIAGLMLLFNFAGFTTTGGAILTKFGLLDPSDVGISDAVIVVAGVFSTVVIGALVIGFITRSSPESYLLFGYAGMLLVFLSDLVFVVTYLNGAYGDWTAALASLIVLPIVVGYIHSVISWWGGKE